MDEYFRPLLQNYQLQNQKNLGQLILIASSLSSQENEMVYLQKWPDLRVNWAYLIPVLRLWVSPVGLIPYPKESKGPTTFVVSHNPEQNPQEIPPSEKTH